MIFLCIHFLLSVFVLSGLLGQDRDDCCQDCCDQVDHGPGSVEGCQRGLRIGQLCGCCAQVGGSGQRCFVFSDQSICCGLVSLCIGSACCCSIIVCSIVAGGLVLRRLLGRGIRLLRSPALKALKKSRRFDAPMPIERIAELAKPFLSLGNQYGEGWFLTGEMAELLTEGIENIICIQPFACLPNHVVGKGVIKSLRKRYPNANIAAVDYDPGASEVNQLNRIKLMLSEAKKRLSGP